MITTIQERKIHCSHIIHISQFKGYHFAGACRFREPALLPLYLMSSLRYSFALLSSVSLAILSMYVYVLSVFLQSIPTLINHNNTINMKAVQLFCFK